MREFHYIAYQNWDDGDVTVHENLYHSISEIVDDLYSLHDDGQSFQFFKIDPFEIEISDVTQEVKDRLSEKANHEYDHGLLDVENLHPLIQNEFSNEPVLEDA